MTREAGPTGVTSRHAACMAAALAALVGCGNERADPDTTLSSGPGAAVTTGTGTGTGGAGGGGGASSGGGAAGSGGDPGEGGASTTGGGQGGAGDGGASSTSTSTGEGAGIPDECGRDGQCLGDDRGACDEGACEAPELFFECRESGRVPDAYVACVVLADSYRVGAWSFLVDCLRDVDAETLCSSGAEAVATCIDETYQLACENPTADGVCEAAFAACDREGEEFPLEQCKTDLVVIGAGGLGSYQDCIDDEEVDGACNGDHETCFALITSP